MSHRSSRLLIASSGILGTLLLVTYFGVGFGVGLASLPLNAPVEQIVSLGREYRNLWFLGTWLQATGSLLSVIFFIALAQQAGRATTLAGQLTLLGSAVLLGVVLVEGVMTINLAQAAISGHPTSSLAGFDIMSVFTYVYPIVPVPVILLSLGAILLKSDVLPRAFGFIAIILGAAFVLVGLVGLFTTPLLTISVLVLQALWELSAAIALLFYSRGEVASTL